MPDKGLSVIVLVKKKWADDVAIDGLLKPEHPTPEQEAAPFYSVWAETYSVDDGWFLEMRFYPTHLKGKPLKLLVPKQEVFAVLQTESPEDLVGFKPPKLAIS